jgi:glycosyltransferase involved in cell wall biosynthesis
VTIGFAWQGCSPTIGGGFTFTQEILTAISHASFPPNWRKLLVRLDDSLIPGSFAFDDNILLKPSDPGVGRLKLILAKIYNKKREKVCATAQTLSGRSLKDSVDVLVFLFPSFLDKCEVPQICTIWDLAHRYVSLFPEISHRGSREERERHFARLALMADKIIVGTERGEHELCRYYGYDPSNVWRIPHPTTLTKSLHGGKVMHVPTQRRQNAAVYPAQFWAHKNHATLVDAWARLRMLIPNPPALIFTGSDKGNEAWIRNMVAEKGLDDLIEFRGFVSQDALINLYRTAKLLVYPSMFGPENLPPLEAMYYGCPAVVSDYPGAREQYGDAALYVDPLDSSAWAACVLRLVSDSLACRHLEARGLERANAFTSDSFAQLLIGKLCDLARTRRLWPTVDHALE